MNTFIVNFDMNYHNRYEKNILNNLLFDLDVHKRPAVGIIYFVQRNRHK
jgi:hypothetical protein